MVTLLFSFHLETLCPNLRAGPHKRGLERNRSRYRSTRTAQTGWEGYDGFLGGDLTEATHRRSVPETHRVHPCFVVQGHRARAASQRILRPVAGLRRSTDGPSEAEYEALQMEEDKAIDTELRGLQFG